MTKLSRREVFVAALAVSAVSQTSWAAEDTTFGTWDLTDLYPSDAAWAADRQASLDALPRLAALKGTLGKDAGSLRTGLQAISDVNKALDRQAVYASLKADADTSVAANQEMRELSDTAYAKFGESIAWISPEILAMGAAKVAAFEAADPGLSKFKFQLSAVLLKAPHTLGEEAEGVLAAAESPLSGPGDIRTQLVLSDIPYPTVTLKDGPARLDAQGYTAHRGSPDRAERKQVFDAYWPVYSQYKTSLASALSGMVRGHMFRAKSRHYGNSLQAALAGDNIPEGVYRTLIAETRAGLPALHRYFDVRRRLLNLPDMHYYDLYPPVTSSSRAFTLAEARTLTLEAVAPLGKDYVDTLSKATSARWMNAYPSKGKASGAYMNGSAYDVHPYLLLNHNNNYEGVTTFAHEWGHAMHTVLARRAQPYEMSNYPTFTAEIASTHNEQLLSAHMQAGAKTKAEKLFYLDALLELIRGTFFRQAMFGEFELAMHETVEKGEALSADKLTAMYLDLLKAYHGPGVVIDEAYAIEWASVPHFYYNFYVYQYATSIAASAYFSQQTITGDPKKVENYLGVLRAGGSDYPVEILKRAGLDMTTPAPYRALVAKFTAALDEIEKVMAS